MSRPIALGRENCIPIAAHTMISSSSTGDVAFLIVEVGIAIITLLVAFAFPEIGGGLFAPIEKWAGRLANRPKLAMLLIGISAPLIRLSSLPWAPIRKP